MKIRKRPCVYCHAEKGTNVIHRHEKSCWLNPKNTKLCSVCKLPIKDYTRGTTCSYACSNTEFRTGEDNGNWKTSAYRSTCFLYHEKKCVVCGEENIVEVHHLNEDHNDNRPENLTPLCPTHHQYFHSRFQYMVLPKIDAYIKKYRENFGMIENS